MFIYVIASSARGPVKIGYATNIIARLCNLQNGNPYRLRVFFAAEVPDAPAIERIAHSHYHRQRLTGEWFKIAAEQAKAYLIEVFTVQRIQWEQWKPDDAMKERRQAQLLPVKHKPKIKTDRASLALDELEYYRRH